MLWRSTKVSKPIFLYPLKGWLGKSGNYNREGLVVLKFEVNRMFVGCSYVRVGCADILHNDSYRRALVQCG